MRVLLRFNLLWHSLRGSQFFTMARTATENLRFSSDADFAWCFRSWTGSQKSKPTQFPESFTGLGDAACSILAWCGRVFSFAMVIMNSRFSLTLLMTSQRCSLVAPRLSLAE